jgi:hypothetical protein
MRYIKGILWMVNQRATQMKKDEFKGSSRKGNLGLNTRTLKKTFK